MKVTVLSILILISVIATVAKYGDLESGVNMVEMLALPFTPEGRTSAGALVFGGPFLVLFIAICAVRFIGVPLVASAVAAALGAWGLRQTNRSISTRSCWSCSAIAAACAAALVLGVIQRDMLPLDRPGKKPETPPLLLACLAGANAAFSLVVGTFLSRRITACVSPDPTPKSTSLSLA